MKPYVAAIFIAFVTLFLVYILPSHGEEADPYVIQAVATKADDVVAIDVFRLDNFDTAEACDAFLHSPQFVMQWLPVEMYSLYQRFGAEVHTKVECIKSSDLIKETTEWNAKHPQGQAI